MPSDALCAKALASRKKTSRKEQLRPLLFPFVSDIHFFPRRSLVADTHLELIWKIDLLVCTHSLTHMVLALHRCIPYLRFNLSLDSLRNLLNWTPNKQRSSKSERLNSWYVSQNKLPHFEDSWDADMNIQYIALFDSALSTRISAHISI
jgi:hypothetical protein